MQKKELAKNIIPNARIEKRIFWLRGEKVMLDSDLAELYEVETKVLVQAVKRNAERFPKDFMFQLFDREMEVLRSQIVTSNGIEAQIKRGGRRYNAYAFTELGVAMLSSVLKSDRAVAVNIQIMRTFVQLRNMLMTYDALRKKIESMERKYDKQLQSSVNISSPSFKRKNGLSDKMFRFRLQILKSSSGYLDSSPHFLRIFARNLNIFSRHEILTDSELYSMS